MGVFDHIKDVPPINCVKCGAPIDGWQSKDAACICDTIPYWQVDNFYASCQQCWTWHEWIMRKPAEPRPISDYEMIATESRAPHRPVFKDGKWGDPFAVLPEIEP